MLLEEKELGAYYKAKGDRSRSTLHMSLGERILGRSMWGRGFIRDKGWDRWM